MKTKTLLLIFLFLGFGLTQLSAQNGTKGTGVVNIIMPSDYWAPIYFDGVKVGDLGGTVKWHVQFFYKEGVLIRVYSHIDHIMIINSETGEIFKVTEQMKADYIDVAATDHLNLIGNQGTHYIGYFTVTNWNDDNPLGVYTIEKVIYPQGPK